MLDRRAKTRGVGHLERVETRRDDRRIEPPEHGSEQPGAAGEKDLRVVIGHRLFVIDY
jgi:hypothetical protein